MLSAGSTNKEYAKNLFAALREFDELGVEVVFAEFSEKDGYGLAVKNRLYKSGGSESNPRLKPKNRPTAPLFAWGGTISRGDHWSPINDVGAIIGRTF